MSILLLFVGIAVFCVGVVAGLRGHISWAHLPNRRRGAALLGLVLFLAGGALAKPVQPVTLTTSSQAPVARASTRSPLVKAAADQAAAAKATADQAAAAKATADQAAAAKATADQAAAAKAVPPPPAPAAPAHAAPTAQVFANCTDLHVVYPHGVGRPGAVDQVGGSTRPVTTFFVSEDLYNANSFSDRDGDGIACEKR